MYRFPVLFARRHMLKLGDVRAREVRHLDVVDSAVSMFTKLISSRVIGTRFYSNLPKKNEGSKVNDDPDLKENKENLNSSEKSMIVEYAESRRQPEYRIEPWKTNLPDALIRIGTLETQLDVANDIICDLLMLVDIRFDVEAKFIAYWLLTPKSTTWQNDMANLVQKELGSLVVSVASPSTIASPLKQKISNLLDESFLKWVYVFKHSIDPFFVDLRTKVSDKDVILMARDLSYVLIVVHHSTHKLIPNSLKIKKPSNDAIKKSLVENYKISEPAIDILFRVLGRA